MRVERNQLVPNSFGLRSVAPLLVHLEKKADIPQSLELARENGLPLLVLGSGTNVIPSERLEAVVALTEERNIVRRGEFLEVQAGEDWDRVVEFAVEQNLTGLEALSLIPGKAGSAPIQNIGAYSSELADNLISVECYDTKVGEFIKMSKTDCAFGYRDSIFKREPQRFIVASLLFKLSETEPVMPDYKDVLRYFAERENNSPTLKQIREAIIKIRQGKLPDYKELPNCGSFFKNPIIENDLATKLKSEFPDLPAFPAGSKTKIPAGYLLDQAGLKGKTINNIGVYERNALVLTNPNHASFADLLSAKDQIIDIIFQKFGITLEPEVNIIE